jgi:protein associated with RNAse G/E
MTDRNSLVTINSRKFDGRIHRSWRAKLLEETEEFFLFVGEFDSEVKHSKLGVIRRGTVSYEYYWKNEWYNVFRFHEPGGDLRNFYCNVNRPPQFENGVLDYIDLEIDILVWSDFSVEILDLDEYEESSRTFDFPDEVKYKVDESLNKLLEMIKERQFPFDFK